MTLILVTLALVVAVNRQYIMDVAHFWAYKPSPVIESIANKSAFTDGGKFAFYVTRPEVQTGAEFNKHCDRKEQGTAILGCYVNDRIYIFDVTDERLDGIEEVTAAHEMLHAVYQRMSGDERAKIDKLIEMEYEKMKSDPDLADRMAFYARTEPGERNNELHSIIGTEVTTVHADLEAHYAKYMSDRKGIVKLYNGYNKLFAQLESQAGVLSETLDKLSAEIESGMGEYNSGIKRLNADIANFNQRASAGDFPSQSAFNNERSELQRRVTAINDLRTAINQKVDQYESTRQQYNNTVTESHTLYESIDSTLAPAPSV